MATLVAHTQIRDLAPSRVPAATDLTSVLSKVAAVLAVAGGLIHLAVVRHHLDYAVIAAGFALMGGAQLLVAVGLFTRSTSRSRLAGFLLHAGIVVTWLLSRTVGLVIVPGAEGGVPFGVADTTANVFALGVIASLGTIGRIDHLCARVRLSTRVERYAVGVIALAAVGLTGPAAFAPHEHAGHDHLASSEPTPGQDDHPPTVDIHDDHHHDPD